MNLQAFAITESIADHAEGPVSLDDDGQTFAWLDMLVGDILVTNVSTGSTERFELDESVVSMVRPTTKGGLLVATERELAVYPSGLGGPSCPLATIEIAEDIRMNDGGCDTHGRAWIGTMAYDVTPGAAELFVIDRTGDCRVVLRDLTIANGLAFTPDGRTAYFIDSTTHAVDRLTFDTDGEFAGREQWATLDPSWGLPDGLTLDADGGVWVAVFGGSRVVRIARDGELSLEVTLPVSQPTSCAFAGTTNTLLITTSRYALAADEQPQAGSLFAVEVPHCGTPVLPFAVSDDFGGAGES